MRKFLEKKGNIIIVGIFSLEQINLFLQNFKVNVYVVHVTHM